MPYRFDVALTSHARCMNSECQNKGENITRGSLRCGTAIRIKGVRYFSWRHWGCVTPLVVATITQEWVEASNGPVNPDLLEGWDELTEDEQAKVIRAIMNGRVDDTDWRGDPEMNVIGAVGFRSKKSKTEAPPKKATGKKRARGASPTEEDGEPSSKSARRGRGRGRGGGRGSRGVCGDPKEAA